MTKRKRTATIIVSVLLAAILIAIAVCAIIGNSKNDKTEPTKELASWQSMIKDETPLKKVAIPGAHDAGTVGMPYFTSTQDRSITQQLNCGIRYLDLRVSYAKGKLLMYHGPSKGIALTSVLDDVCRFLTENPSENVILDFQHFEEKEHEAQDATIKLIEEKMIDRVISTQLDSSLNSDAKFIEELTLGEARGKALVFWGREYQTALEKKYVFLRNDDEGEREICALQSYYYGNLHKKSSAYFIENALPKYLEKFKNSDSTADKGLFVLQGQLTDGLYILGPRFREATHTDNMNRFTEELRASEYLDTINIIMRDFVTPHKNCLTISLNSEKSNVKEDMREKFDKMIQDNGK